MRKLLPILLVLALPLLVSAQTTFLGGNINDTNNWSNGFPVGTNNPGTSAVGGTVGFETVTNWYFNHTAGALVQGGFPNVNLKTEDGAWTMNGGTLSIRQITIRGTNIWTLNDGVYTGSNNKDCSAADDAQFVINGGTFSVSRHLDLQGNSALVMSGGELTAPNGRIGSQAVNGGGFIYLNGGTITADRYNAKNTTELTFGGTAEGSFTVRDWGTGPYTGTGDRMRDDHILINFQRGSKMTMSVTNARPLEIPQGTTNSAMWAEVLWDNNQLQVDGLDKSVLGLTWAEATTEGAFGNYYFKFASSNAPLSLYYNEPAGLPFLVDGKVLALGGQIITQPAPRWSPLDIAARLWYDASDADTVLESAGAVYQWDDKSGNGYNITQGTGSKQPTYGTRSVNNMPVIDFTTAHSMQRGNFGYDVGLFTVFMVKDFDGGTAHLSHNGSGGSRAFIFQTDRLSMQVIPDVTYTALSGTNMLCMVVDKYGLNEVTAYVNGSDEGSSSLGSDPGIGGGSAFRVNQNFVGGSNGDGGLCEIVVLDSISQNDREKTEGYLAHKWGIASELPVIHPYRGGPPLQ